MSETKTTPGPWQCVRDANTLNTIQIASSEGNEVCVIGQWSTDHLRPGDETALADARLIAAAPDLLEALKYIVAWEPKDWDPETARGLARAAIAKAEGR